MPRFALTLLRFLYILFIVVREINFLASLLSTYTNGRKELK